MSSLVPALLPLSSPPPPPPPSSSSSSSSLLSLATPPLTLSPASLSNASNINNNTPTIPSLSNASNINNTPTIPSPSPSSSASASASSLAPLVPLSCSSSSSSLSVSLSPASPLTPHSLETSIEAAYHTITQQCAAADNEKTNATTSTVNSLLNAVDLSPPSSNISPPPKRRLSTSQIMLLRHCRDKLHLTGKKHHLEARKIIALKCGMEEEAVKNWLNNHKHSLTSPLHSVSTPCTPLLSQAQQSLLARRRMSSLEPFAKQNTDHHSLGDSILQQQLTTLHALNAKYQLPASSPDQKLRAALSSPLASSQQLYSQTNITPELARLHALPLINININHSNSNSNSNSHVAAGNNETGNKASTADVRVLFSQAIASPPPSEPSLTSDASSSSSVAARKRKFSAVELPSDFLASADDVRRVQQMLINEWRLAQNAYKVQAQTPLAHNAPLHHDTKQPSSPYVHVHSSSIATNNMKKINNIELNCKF